MQASLHGYYFLSACLGAVAVAFRQTAAVWVAFILGMAILNKVLETDPRARRLPAEKQLLHVLRACLKVRKLFAHIHTSNYDTHCHLQDMHLEACMPESD